MDVVARNQIRLVVLVFLAFLPGIGLYMYAGEQFREHELHEHQNELLSFAHVAAVEYQQLLNESRDLLGALAEFPEIRAGRGRACEERLASVVRHTPAYTTVSVIASDGYLACGSLTVDEDLYLGDRMYFKSAMSSGRFSVGLFAVGRITGKPIVGTAMPITVDGEVTRVLAGSIDLGRLGSNALDMEIPEAATLTVIDRRGTVVVRVPSRIDPQGRDTVGAPFDRSTLSLAEEVVAPYVDEGSDVDGTRRLFAIATLGEPGLKPDGYLLVGRDLNQVSAMTQEVSRSELRYLALAGAAVLILVWAYGHFSLVREGRRLARELEV